TADRAQPEAVNDRVKNLPHEMQDSGHGFPVTGYSTTPSIHFRKSGTRTRLTRTSWGHWGKKVSFRRLLKYLAAFSIAFTFPIQLRDTRKNKRLSSCCSKWSNV